MTSVNESIRNAAPRKVGLQELSEFARVGTVVVILLYVTGVVVSNVHLYRFGVSDLNPLRARYVLTGCAAFFPMAVCLYSTALSFGYLYNSESGLAFDVRRAFRKYSETKRFKYIAEMLLNVSMLSIYGLFLPIGLISLMLEWVTRTGSFEKVGDAVKFWFLSFLVLSIVHTGSQRIFQSILSVAPRKSLILLPDKYTSRDQGTNIERRRFDNIIAHITDVGFAVFLIWLYLAFFTSDIYPEVPVQLGGGKPRVVQLVVNSGRDDLLVSLGLVSDSSQVRSVPVSLLWEGDQQLVIRPMVPDRVASIVVDRSAIAAVIILGPGGTIKTEGAGTPTANASPIARGS